MSSNVTDKENDVLNLIRNQGPMSVGELVEELGVTATAVRQRLSRLTASGLLERVESRQGRGRPCHKYSLTEQGYQQAGDNFSDFAKVLWSEVHNIEDANVRNSVITGVINRLAGMYANQMDGESLEEKLESIARLFADRQVPFHVEQQLGQPVLQITGCPYPDLKETNPEICELEKRLFSMLVEQPLELKQAACECGGSCCTFQPMDLETNKT